MIRPVMMLSLTYDHNYRWSACSQISTKSKANYDESVFIDIGQCNNFTLTYKIEGKL